MAWWKTAKPGDPVVSLQDCTDARLNKPLKENAMYIIRDIYGARGEPSRKCREHNCSTYLLLDGLVTSATDNAGRELAFPAYGFRPAQTTDLPVSLLKCLDATKQKEKV